LARLEVTGIAAPSDVRLLPLVIRAEADRHALTPSEAEESLSEAPYYSSPFIEIPI
jgi:hypothetical protein